MHTFRRILLGVMVALSLQGLASADAPTLSVKGTPTQGSLLFLTLQGAPGADVEIGWENSTFRPGRTDKEGRLRFTLPVVTDGPTGSLTLKVKVGSEEIERKLSVAARQFSLQRLSISPSTLASYDNPQNRADDEAILRVAKKADPVVRWSGNFRYPIQAPETTAYGARRLYNGWKKGWHKGLDLGGREGEPVHAPAAGRVVHTARGLVNGNTVVISHGCGLTTSYYHLQTIDVEMGEPIELGQTLGRVGGTGGFSPHLHWEARSWGVPVDPKALFQMPDGWR